MVRLGRLEFAILLVVADIALCKVSNEANGKNLINGTNVKVKGFKKTPDFIKDTRRKAQGRGRSTSSSTGEKSAGHSEDSNESIGISDSSISTSKEDVKKSRRPQKGQPMSSNERQGWRKWHRKCNQCPEDMVMKWRDPRIKWICGAYQRARRSFKSLCMMYYRNCQDGTMFTKIADHRCPNDTYRGDHFFYDYVVRLSDDSGKSDLTSSSLESHAGSSFDEEDKN